MNKLGIKLYKIDELYINNIHYTVNSIKYHTAISIFKFRIINELQFGIRLDIILKKK